MRFYCTYFDRNYLSRAVAMMTSLRRHSSVPLTIIAVCHDELSRLILEQLALPDVIALGVHDIEVRDEELLRAKVGRSAVEYYWTLTPTIILRLLESNPAIPDLCYVDADLYFYSDPEVLFTEMGDGAVLVHEHRYSSDLASLESTCGRFNVGLLQFKQHPDALTVLRWWRARCNEWCFARPEAGKLGDQKYLDQWPDLFPQMRILQHPGAGVAPWNHARYALEYHGDGGFVVDGMPLVFYHYHSFAIAGRDQFLPLKHPHYPLDEALLSLFPPYITALEEALQCLRVVDPDFNFGHGESEWLADERTLLQRYDMSALPLGLTKLEDGWAYRWGTQQAKRQPQYIESVSDIVGVPTRWQPTSAETLLDTVARQPEARACEIIYLIGANDFRESARYFAAFPNLQTIYLFEPLPDVVALLQQRFADEPRVKIFPYAIAAEDGWADFHVTNNLESSSLLPLEQHKDVFPNVKEASVIRVRVRSIASLRAELALPAPDFMLIDVQGAEYLVLQGLDDACLERMHCLISEVSKVEMYQGAKLLSDVCALLAPRYEMVAFHDMLGTRIHGDALFVNQPRQIRRRDAEALCLAAEQAYGSSDVEQALAYLEQAQDLDDGIADIYNNLGAICLESQLWPQAQLHLNRALRLAPDAQHIAHNVLSWYLLQEQQDDAVHFVADYLSRNPGAVSLAQRVGVDAEPLRKFKVTAVVSTYASGDFIGECLDDLLAQTLGEQIEILIIDAASPEHEGEVVKRYLETGANNIRYIRTPERIGIYAAWNMAIREARGEYLISCSTNDRLRRDACERLVHELDCNPDIALVYGDSYVTTIPHQTFEQHTLAGVMVWPEYTFDALLNNCMVGPHPMWRRSLHATLGYFDESYLAIADQDMWLRIAEHHQLKHIPFVTGLFWQTGDSLSGDPKRSSPEISRVRNKFRERANYSTWLLGHSVSEVEIDGFAQRYFERGQSIRFELLTIVPPGDDTRLVASIAALERLLGHNWRLIAVSEQPAPDPVFHEQPYLGWIQVASLASEEVLAEVVEHVLGESDAPYLAVLPAGFAFEPHALLLLEDYFERNPAWQALYVDHNVVELSGSYEPSFKPDFDPYYLCSHDYIGEAVFWRQEALRDLGGFLPYLGAEQFEALLRLFERAGRAAIGHVADPVLHLPETSMTALHTAARQVAIEQYWQRQGIVGQVQPSLHDGVFRLELALSGEPLVSIIVPSRDQFSYLQSCIESLLEKTDYPHYELLVVDNASSDPDVLDYYQELADRLGDRFKVLHYDGPFNFAAQVNLGVAHASGHYALLLNNDTEIVQPQWLTRMLSLVQLPGVGIVGARLVYPESGKIQHAGMMGGGQSRIDAVADHLFNGCEGDAPGRLNALVSMRRCWLSAACMLVPKSLFQSLGGFDAVNLGVRFSDVDFCLRAEAAGYDAVYHPDATLVHHGSISMQDEARGKQKLLEQLLCEENEHAYMLRTWKSALAQSPNYNRNLDLASTSCIASTTPIRWDPLLAHQPRLLASRIRGGSGDYRVEQPLWRLRESGQLHSAVMPLLAGGNVRLPTLLELERMQCDILLLHTPLSDAHLEAMRLYREFRPGMRVLATMDDLVSKIPEKSSAYVYHQRYFRDARYRLRQALAYVDRLIVSTPPLANELSAMCTEVVVVPNRLSKADWGGLRRKPRAWNGRKPRLGWVGAQQHQGDLALIVEVVRATHNEVDWVFMGMWPDEVASLIKEKHEGVPFQQYPQTMAMLDLDLAIAPLEDLPFNRCKSNLRLLEYGALGWPVLCSDVEPYRENDAPVCRLPNDDPDAWITAIRERIAAPERLRLEGERLHAWVAQHYWLEEHLDEWMAVLTKFG
ncbi:MAG: FkbM family methyltransferase [Vogesella sp.]|nr:FkbM family methyltransferase [Vogesella sp.]